MVSELIYIFLFLVAKMTLKIDILTLGHAAQTVLAQAATVLVSGLTVAALAATHTSVTRTPARDDATCGGKGTEG